MVLGTIGRTLTDSDGLPDVGVVGSEAMWLMQRRPTRSARGERRSAGRFGRLQARRGAEAKPALLPVFGLLEGDPHMISKKQKVAAALGAGAVAVAGSGVAFAFWSASGTGTGSAATSAGASNLAIAQ